MVSRHAKVYSFTTWALVGHGKRGTTIIRASILSASLKACRWACTILATPLRSMISLGALRQLTSKRSVDSTSPTLVIEGLWLNTICNWTGIWAQSRAHFSFITRTCVSPVLDWHPSSQPTSSSSIIRLQYIWEDILSLSVTIDTSSRCTKFTECSDPTIPFPLTSIKFKLSLLVRKIVAQSEAVYTVAHWNRPCNATPPRLVSENVFPLAIIEHIALLSTIVLLDITIVNILPRVNITFNRFWLTAKSILVTLVRTVDIIM